VTTAPTVPASSSVVRAPSSAAAGAVRANDTGRPAMEMNQSRLETRPISSGGTKRCLVAAQAIVPAASIALITTEASTSCQRDCAIP